jgi:hypothetical protein
MDEGRSLDGHFVPTPVLRPALLCTVVFDRLARGLLLATHPWASPSSLLGPVDRSGLPSATMMDLSRLEWVQ